MHDVIDYDSDKNFAIPGDTVESTSGGLLPSREYQIQWFKDGEPIGNPVTKTSNVDGTIGSVPITVPADLDKNATYTSAIFQPNESTTNLYDALAVDSFTAVVDDDIINEPAYEDTDATAGEEAKVTPKFTNKNGEEVATSDVPLSSEAPFILDPEATDVPEGVTVDPKTGEITFKPSADQIGKTITVPVVVTYEDGTTETVKAKFTVTSQADKYDPAVTSEEVAKGGEVDLKDNVDLTKLPEGTTVKDVTPEGTINTDQPGDYTGKVEVTYPDGSKETVDVPVTVKPSQADENDPTVTPEEVAKGGEVDLKDNVDLTKLPEGTTVKDVTPEGTINTDKPGDYTGKVEVTYPDGSKETVDVPVTVKPSQADENDPAVTPEVVEKGGEVDLKDNVDLTKLPEGTKVEDVTPEGTINTDQPGDYTGKVEVTYPDGSKETVDVPVTVKEKLTDADKNDPTVTPEEVVKGGEVDLKDNVDVTKLPEGTTVKDVTPEGTINTDQPGDYTGKVEVTYPDGSKETVDVPVTVKPSQADENDPAVTPEVVEKGGKVDLTDNVDVTKLPEGTTVKDVTPEGTIDTDKTGDYTGKVEVTYLDGSKETVDVPVTVKDELTDADKNDPTVTPEVVEKGGKVDLTDNVDLTELPEGTKVEDVTPEGDVNTDETGDYTGKVEVTYPDGSKETVDVPVTVKDELTDADKNDPTVTPEEVEKGGEVDLTDNVDVTKLPEGTIDTDKPGDYTGKVEVTYPDGSKETVDVPVSVKDTVAPEAPTVDPVKAGDTTVTGKGEPGSTITVKFPNGEEGTATVDENGNWTVDVPKGTEIKPGDELDVTATDEAGNTSDVTKVKVPDTEKDMVAPEAPIVDPVKAGDTTVTGKGEPGSTITVKFPNGEEGTATVDENGNWTVDVPKGTEIKPGDELDVTATDEAGNTSDVTKVKVPDTEKDMVAPEAPTVDPVKAGDKTVTGKGEPGSTITVKFPNGEEGTAKVDKDGNWTVDVPKGTEIKPGDELDVTATDEAGNTSDVTKVKVPDTEKDMVAPEAPTVDPVKAGDKTVTGKGEPGSTITVKFPNGEEGTAKVDENGNWTVDVPKGTEIKPGDELDVTATDEAGNTSDVTKVKVPTDKDTVAPEKPQVNPVNPGDKEVTGKGEPGSTITVKFPNGEEGTAKVDKDGNWTVKVPKGTEIKPGDKLIVTATDEAGNTSEPTEVIVGGMADNGMADMDQNGKDMGDMDNNMKDMDNMDAMPGMKADMKSSKDMNNNGKEMKELPETGNESTNAPLFGSLIAALGSLFLLGRRRKENEEK
ncbi:Rib/alpha-like domain-containing protein [Staphylococcus sp. IVB6214]|nr:Rib/alpha-like domain-containing protein [Staphylococcus sp. IVB6214]